MNNLTNEGMIDAMYNDWTQFKGSLPMYSVGYLWQRWIRTL